MTYFDETPERERLQPSLLDRLVDEEPHQTKEPPHRRVLDEHRLRESVKRDLAWLLGTTNRGAAPFPERAIALDADLANSVLNFGVPDLIGRAASSFEKMPVAELERQIRQAILDFEPRLRRQSLRIERRAAASGDEEAERVATGHHLAFRIEGELLAYPVQLRLLLEAVVDVENGDASVTDSVGRGR